MRRIHGIQRILLGALLLLAAGCMNRELTRVDPITGSWLKVELPPQGSTKVDILVVVDKSGSMQEEQVMLGETFPNLIRSILDPPIDPATGRRVHPPVRDLHIGVVSTDMGVGGYPDVPTCEDNPAAGDDGILQHAPTGEGCDPAYPDFLSYGLPLDEANPDLAVVDKLARDFGCIAVLGTVGCGFEQQLEASRKALADNTRPGGPNAGFLRSESVLTILYVSDENDCSAEDTSIFDPATFGPKLDLQCFNNRSKLHGAGYYQSELASLKENPDDLIIGMIVGVPPGEPECNGGGDEIQGCLLTDPMQEIPEGDYLRPACRVPEGCSGDACTGLAYPATRFVELAQMFGKNAVVQSICTDTFVPAVEALTAKLRDRLTGVSFRRTLQVEKDPGNPCRCVAACTIIEELSDNRPCPEGKVPYDADGDTIGETRVNDETGQVHTLCEIPQAGAVIDDCALECDNPAAAYSKDAARDGWWYNPFVDSNHDGIYEPTVILEDAMPEEGSAIGVQCNSLVCPESRSCGALPSRSGRCCDVNEYCIYPGGDQSREGACLLRSDVCDEFGGDLWCPGAGPAAGDPLIGGLCCLDPEGDGELDMTDADGDGLLDTPLYRCDAGACIPR